MEGTLSLVAFNVGPCPCFSFLGRFFSHQHAWAYSLAQTSHDFPWIPPSWPHHQAARLYFIYPWPPWLASKFVFTFGPSSWNVNHPASIKHWTLCLRVTHFSIECLGVPPWYALMQSYRPRALDRRLQEDWVKDAREGPRVLMSPLIFVWAHLSLYILD